MQSPSVDRGVLLPLPGVVLLVCGSLSGILLASLVLAAGLERISLGVCQLLGVGEAPEMTAERPLRR